MKKDGTAAYGTVFHIVFVITDDINLNVNLLSTIRTTNLHLINVAHYKLQIRYSKHIFEQFLDRQRLSRLGAASHQKEEKIRSIGIGTPISHNKTHPILPSLLLIFDEVFIDFSFENQIFITRLLPMMPNTWSSHRQTM